MSSNYIDLPVVGGSGSGVSSLNSLTGALNLIAGTGITVTPSGTNITIAATGAGSGTVTSVALTAPSSILTVSGSPVTTSGTLALSLASTSQNFVWAGPTSGSGTPTYRALVAGDIPTLPYLSTTLGTANGLSVSTNTLSLGTASTSTTGALTSTDWNTFNGKQAAGSYITALTGDVVATGPGSVAATIQSNVVTNAKLAQMAANTIKGNNTGSTANALDLTTTQVTAMLNQFTTSLQGVVPGSGGGTTNFLRADGTWAAPSGGGSGTVTSVALSDASTTPIYNISGSPVTTSGTLAFTFKTQSANTVLAGPTSGGAVQPTFRSLVAADIPSLSGTYLPLAGGTMSGNINMGNDSIVNINQLAIGQTSAAAGTAIDIVNSTGSTQTVQGTGYAGSVGFRGRYANGTSGSPTAAVNGNILSFSSGRGYGATQFAVASTGAIDIVAGETFTDTSNATYINFLVTPTGSVTAAEAMRVNSTGNVLIGSTTDNATDKLQVTGSINATTALKVNSININALIGARVAYGM